MCECSRGSNHPLSPWICWRWNKTLSPSGHSSLSTQTRLHPEQPSQTSDLPAAAAWHRRLACACTAVIGFFQNVTPSLSLSRKIEKASNHVNLHGAPRKRWWPILPPSSGTLLNGLLCLSVFFTLLTRKGQANRLWLLSVNLSFPFLISTSRLSTSSICTRITLFAFRFALLIIPKSGSVSMLHPLI